MGSTGHSSGEVLNAGERQNRQGLSGPSGNESARNAVGFSEISSEGPTTEVYGNNSKDGVAGVDGNEQRKSVMDQDEAMDLDRDDSRDVGGDARPVPSNDGEKGKGTRSSTRKRKTPPPSKREGGDGKPRLSSTKKSKPKPRVKKESGSKSESKSKSLPHDDSEHVGMLNYFEEIEIDGGSRLVYMYDLTQVMVRLFLTQSLLC
jgi:hypothetical protein